MLLPATFDYSFELRDWRRYVSMREGRYYQPVFLLGVLVLPACAIGMVLLFPEMLSSPSSTDVMMLTVMAAMVAFSIPSGVFGLIPFGGIRSSAMPFFIRHGCAPECRRPAFRQIVEIGEEGIRLRRGTQGCRSEEMDAIRQPWSMWCSAR